MLRVRVMPLMLLHDGALVKTCRFKDVDYIGEPINTIRIFNELEVDEIILLDILASKQGRGPDFDLLDQIASECFMPLTYGGGLTSIDQVERALTIGLEKVSLNTSALKDLELITTSAKAFGSQSIIGAMDVIETRGGYQVYSANGTAVPESDPLSWARRLEDSGAGELLLMNVSREGTWSGFDTDLLASLSEAVSIPVIASGGAGSVQDIGEAANEGGAAAVALGCMVVYQKQGFGVLINFPDEAALRAELDR